MQQAQARFRQQGLGVASLTYDTPETLRDFGQRLKITFPMLADPKSEVIRAFRMVDPDNTENNIPKYGDKNTAYPGWFWILPNGTVKERFIDGAYDDRRTASSVILALFPQVLETRSAPLKTPHFNVMLGQTDRRINPGSRFTLVVDITLPKKMHLYAPGVTGYKPVELVVNPAMEIKPQLVVYPKSKHLRLKVIKETVPVFEGRVRITQDIIISDSSKVMRTLPPDFTQSRALVIEGVLRYQACDDQICYRPAEIPVKWEFNLHLNDNQRPAPENQKRIAEPGSQR